jgi:hypothetical protein
MKAGRQAEQAAARPAEGLFLRGKVVAVRSREVALKRGGVATVQTLVVLAAGRVIEVEAWPGGQGGIALPPVNEPCELTVRPKAYLAQGRACWRLGLEPEETRPPTRE